MNESYLQLHTRSLIKFSFFYTMARSCFVSMRWYIGIAGMVDQMMYGTGGDD